MPEPYDDIQPVRINKAADWNSTAVHFQRNGVEIATINDVNAVLPNQAGQAGKFLETDGINPHWVAGGGGGLPDPGSNGMLSRTALNIVTPRTLIAASNKILITNGNGVVGNPMFDVIEANLSLQNIGGGLLETQLNLSDNTIANVSIVKHGFTPKLPNDVTKYLDGTGNYTVPPGGGGTVTSVTASAPLASSGGINPNIALDGTNWAWDNGAAKKFTLTGNQKLTGKSAFGSNGAYGTNGGVTTNFDFAETISDFTVSNEFRIFHVDLQLDPTADTVGKSIKGNVFEVAAVGNHNHGDIIAAWTLAHSAGNGNITALVGGLNNVFHVGTGTVTLQEGVSMESSAIGTGSILTNYGAYFRTGHNGAAGTIGDDRSIFVQTPYLAQTLTFHAGMYMADQTAGGNGYAIYIAGGPIYTADKIGVGIKPDRDIDLVKTVVGGQGVRLRVRNADNTNATSDALIEFEVGGAAAGDPKFVYSVSGVTNWSAGIDNDDNDKYKIAANANFGLGDDFVEMDPGNKTIQFLKRVLGKRGANIASANDVTLGLDGDDFLITGNTQINRIALANWSAGSRFQLEFSGIPTIKHNQAAGGGFATILIDGNLDYIATAGSIVDMYFNGTNFYLHPFYTA